MMWGVPTPVPGAAPPAREKLANGLFVWDPKRDSDGYWALPLPCTPEQMEYNRRALNAPLRKDRG